tara:strand:- start:2160 stop:2540 length:381 start_codon:yes stop_codon:yes gene_type:complete
MKIFIDPNDYFEINLFIGEENDRLACVLEEDEAKEKFKDGKYESHWVRFERPNYGHSVKIQELTFNFDSGKTSFDPISFRHHRCSVLLKDWSFVDENNNKIPATADNMEQMDEAVAGVILLELDKI